MKYNQIILEEKEYQFIQNLVKKFLASDETQNEAWIIKLTKELSRAIVKKENEMPVDVIKIGSKVDVETLYGRRNNIILVKPTEKNINENKISLLSPMGSALIGYAQGDEVDWDLPKGKSTIKILNVVN
ncbi:GreA/GreB family elongation factor [Marivirga sp.]|uniref:GreA/GreB family elongation factor n=1 Tax=Marivirga sp. TaxID=2018662 RepID=UPI002D7FFE31|nr:GreA/GreB family elongation factor [Marivirga sp.]HET8860742.1 GreA/GreB family elongation factor [Marivirga sp.]